jgi:very-short-patch-repair endonuclease
MRARRPSTLVGAARVAVGAAVSAAGAPRGRFIADFYAPRARVVVEVDGGWHSRRGAADARRDAKLGRLGYRVLRVSAELVMADLPAAVAVIRAALTPPG